MQRQQFVRSFMHACNWEKELYDVWIVFFLIEHLVCLFVVVVVDVPSSRTHRLVMKRKQEKRTIQKKIYYKEQNQMCVFSCVMFVCFRHPLFEFQHTKNRLHRSGPWYNLTFWYIHTVNTIIVYNVEKLVIKKILL
jgi:hypothetical protein